MGPFQLTMSGHSPSLRELRQEFKAGTGLVVQHAIPHSITSDQGVYFTTKKVQQEQRMMLSGRSQASFLI